MEENKGLSYFFLGLGLGVAVGMIFAPQAGSDTRGLLRNKAAESGGYLRRRGEDLKEGAEDLLQRGKTIVTNQREQFTAAVEAGKQAYRESISQAAEPSRTSGSEAL